MTSAMLSLTALSKVLRTPFSRKPGFHVGPMDLTINEAEIVGLIGANGAGKTSTIKMILGLLVPDAGSVQFAGASTGWTGKVGYLPEQPAFYDYLSGQEFMTFVGDLFGLDAATLGPRVEHLLDRVGLSDRKSVV